MKKNSFISVLYAVILAAVVFSSCARNNNKMVYRINPHTGDKVSLLGFGCMRFPMIENEERRRVVDQEAVNRLIDMAIAGGVNFFDCAPMYLAGQCETVVGIALQRHNREDFFVATKMSNFNDFTFEFAKEMYERSFRDLQVDYIDYYFLHSIGSGGIDRFRQRFIDNGVLDFLIKEKEAGRIRNLGWSFHGDIAAFDTLFEMGIQWDFGMIQMNYIDWQHASPPGRNINADYLYAKTVENNVPVIIMEPLLGGRLANLGPLAISILNEVNPNMTPVEWAFRWLYSPNILTILSGMNKDEHVIENLATFSPLKPLNKRELEAIDKVTQIMTTAGYINCTGCDYCVPCPFGVDIPGVLLRYNEYITAGKQIDVNDPLLQQATLCRDCGLCEPLCPQRIRIVRELKRIDSIVKQF